MKLLYNIVPYPGAKTWKRIETLPYDRFKGIVSVWNSDCLQYRKVAFRDGTVLYYQGPFVEFNETLQGDNDSLTTDPPTQ